MSLEQELLEDKKEVSSTEQEKHVLAEYHVRGRGYDRQEEPKGNSSELP